MDHAGRFANNNNIQLLGNKLIIMFGYARSGSLLENSTATRDIKPLNSLKLPAMVSVNEFLPLSIQSSILTSGNGVFVTRANLPKPLDHGCINLSHQVGFSNYYGLPHKSYFTGKGDLIQIFENFNCSTIRNLL